MFETEDELNPLAKEMMQNDLRTVKQNTLLYFGLYLFLKSHYAIQKFPWILADTEAVTAFEESSLIPLKSLDSEVFKVIDI